MTARGRRVAPGDAAHPIAAAVFLTASFLVLGVTLGVLVADWGWSWLTTVLGVVAVALAVMTAVCLIPDTLDDDELGASCDYAPCPDGCCLPDDEGDAPEEYDPERPAEYPATWPTRSGGIPAVKVPTEVDRCFGCGEADCDGRCAR